MIKKKIAIITKLIKADLGLQILLNIIHHN